MINVMILSSMGNMGLIYFMDIVIHFPVLGNEQNLFFHVCLIDVICFKQTCRNLVKTKISLKRKNLKYLLSAKPPRLLYY